MPDRLLVVEHERDAGLSLMRRHLPGAEVVRPYLGEPLPSTLKGVCRSRRPGRVHGRVGGRRGGLATAHPSIVGGCRPGRSTTLGICLGAQLLALACGGTAERESAGLEIGTTTARPGADGDEVLAALVDGLGPRWPARNAYRTLATRTWNGFAAKLRSRRV